MPAELPVLGFHVTLPSVGKFKVPLDKHISFIAVRHCFKQDLEAFPGFRSRHVPASKLSDVCRPANALAQPILSNE